VREAIRAVDDGVPVFRIQTMEEILRFERRVEAFGTLLLALFAGMGLLMAGVGIYGVLSYVTGRRTREIGLRVALGARRWDVMREVTVRTLGTCAVGLAVGCLGAAGMARMMESLVVDVRAFSPLVYGSTALVVLAMALAASAPPTMRALRIHPREALGQE
jgi:ABC-type antimicrobial peptide transport system permease subunit